MKIGHHMTKLAPWRQNGGWVADSETHAGALVVTWAPSSPPSIASTLTAMTLRESNTSEQDQTLVISTALGGAGGDTHAPPGHAAWVGGTGGRLHISRPPSLTAAAPPLGSPTTGASPQGKGLMGARTLSHTWLASARGACRVRFGMAGIGCGRDGE